MDAQTELALMDELRDLKARKSAFLDAEVGRASVEHYLSQAHFEHEQGKIFRSLPQAVAHVSELSEPDSFLRRDLANVPILLTREKSGQLNAFLNVCRHRGTRLVAAESGCKKRFTCPYHAWTYANSGALIAAPHFESGFPEAEKSELGLTRLKCVEKYGFIWVAPNPSAELDLETYFDALDPDLTALNLAGMKIGQAHTETRTANWKLLVEGGLEAYHFKVAHRDTIGPYFEDNLSSYRAFGPHIRSILPRTSLGDLAEAERENWHLREHANLLYTLFPSSQLLVQQDHIVWIHQTPLAPNQTRLRLVTLVPGDRVSEEAHWQRNHAITSTTLNEDFELGESIQACLASGANKEMLFGRFEGALTHLNRTLSDYLETGDHSQ